MHQPYTNAGTQNTMTIGQYHDMREEEIRPGEGNAFSDECVRLAGDKPVLLRRDQREALRCHLAAIAAGLDDGLWVYRGMYYELHDGALGPNNVHVLRCSEFDPNVPAPNSIELGCHNGDEIPF